MKSIALIDFGAGNLHSVYKALKFIGANVEITNNSQIIEGSSAIVFPGVGAFGSVMSSIKKNNLEEIIIKSAQSKKPFLGICIGMQVLFESGEENPEEKGLGIFKGNVVKFKKAKKVPHIGWNDVFMKEELINSSFNIGKFYFVHSYYVVSKDKSIIAAETDYDGEVFTSVIKNDNLLAVQFHPEKSGEVGLNLLETFVKSIN